MSNESETHSCGQEAPGEKEGGSSADETASVEDSTSSMEDSTSSSDATASLSDGKEESVDEDEPEDELERAKADAAENHDLYLRAAAELQNFRKRTVKMRADAREETLRDVLAQIAPLLDNMRRALGQEASDGQALKQGVELIITQFQDVLKGYGLEEIEAVGQPFDPNVHEAMLEVESAVHPAGIVLEEMEKGYTLRERVMRPARVVVSKGSPGDGAAPDDGDSAGSEGTDETESE